MSLKNKVLSGVYWTSGGRLLSQLVSWTITIVVIRLLTPSDYGLLAMAMVAASILTVLADAGLGAALIQAPTLDDAKVRSVFGAAILLHCGLFVAQFLLAPLVAAYFGEERLVAILRVLAIDLLLSIFGVLPYAFLGRNLEFKSQSIIGVGSTICTSLTTLGLALYGWGIWALILGNLAGRVFDIVVINLVAPVWRRPSFDLKEARDLITFGAKLLAMRVLWLVYSQADVFVAGKLLGKEALGIYGVAMHIASLPVQRLAQLFNTVAYPAFSRIQDDRQRIIGALLKAVRLMSLMGFPTMWGLASVAPEAVRLVLGPTWIQATIPLQLLAIIMPLRMLSAVLPAVTSGIGRPDIQLVNLAIALLVMPAAFIIGSRWGIIGLSAAWVTVYPLVVLENVHRSTAAIGLSMREVWRAAARPIAAAALVCVAVTALRELLPAGFSEWLRLCLLILCGAVVYGAVSWAYNRDGILELRDAVRRDR